MIQRKTFSQKFSRRDKLTIEVLQKIKLGYLSVSSSPCRMMSKKNLTDL